MKRKTQSIMVGTLLAGAAVALSIDVALAAGMGGHGGPRGPAGPGSLMRAPFSELDINGNGMITMEEIQARGAAHFASIDLDGSGALDKAEVTEMILTGIQTRMAERESRGSDQADQPDRPDRPMRQAPDAARIAWMADGMIMRFDQDADNLVTAAEMQAKAQNLERLIGRMDTDGDGQISEAEFDAAKARHGGRGGRGNRGGHGQP